MPMSGLTMGRSVATDAVRYDAGLATSSASSARTR